MSDRRLAIITTRLPPATCGIGAYSALLQQHWPGKTDVEFLVMDGAAAATARGDHSAQRITDFNGQGRRLAEELVRIGQADVLLHYAGRAYHRRGCPIWMPKVLAEWKRKFPGSRLMIFVHELEGKLPRTSRYYWLARVNAWIVRRLAVSADVLCTNLEHHAVQLREITRRTDIRVVPVGSNIIPREMASSVSRLPTEFVVFGLSFGRLQTLQKFAASIPRWHSEQLLTKLHIIGPGEDDFTRQADELIAGFPSALPVVRHGILSSDEVSQQLSAARYALTNVDATTWSKSGTFMAAAAHRCAVVIANERSASGPLSYAIAERELGSLAEAEITHRTRTLQDWFQANAQWPVIAQRMAAFLEPAAGKGSSEEIVVICPELRPGGGGVADYTLRVVEQWPAGAAVRFLVPGAEDHGTLEACGRLVEPVQPSARALLRKLPEQGGKVLLQYSAYGFQHLGYPRWLLRALCEWKQRSGGRLVVMFHEIWAFWPMLNKNYLVQQLHRQHLRQLIAKADAVFTSTASQAGHLSALCKGSAIEVLPVGSNIRPVSSVQSQRQPGLAVLFGLQASRIQTLRKMQNDLESLASRRILRKVVVAGVGQDSAGDRVEHELLGKLQLEEGYEQRGALPESEVSSLLCRASFGLSMQDENSVTKSGTFMAYASHGLSVLSRFASLSQPAPLCWATSPSELRQGISPEQLQTRATRLQEWQEQNCSWPHIAERFAHGLQMDSTLSPRA